MQLALSFPSMSWIHICFHGLQHVISTSNSGLLKNTLIWIFLIISKPDITGENQFPKYPMRCHKDTSQPLSPVPHLRNPLESGVTLPVLQCEMIRLLWGSQSYAASTLMGSCHFGAGENILQFKSNFKPNHINTHHYLLHVKWLDWLDYRILIYPFDLNMHPRWC